VKILVKQLNSPWESYGHPSNSPDGIGKKERNCAVVKIPLFLSIGVNLKNKNIAVN
jgi:hypothetical protein